MKLLLPVALFFCVLQMGAQTLDLKKIEEQVYQLNNQQKFQQSQQLLLKFLKQKNLSPQEKCFINLNLSYTYKRLYDYTSTLKFLNDAHNFAKQTKGQDSIIATINAQRAFAYFDIQQYQKSVQIMDKLAAKKFKHISEENTAKLMMQQGYILFLKQHYSEAEKLYDAALVKLKASSECDIPMILVKKVQLYDKMNRLVDRDQAYKEAVKSADECGIIKYRMYADDELVNIYKKRNEAEKALVLQKELDSLNTAYQKEQKLASLHLEREKVLIESKEEEIVKKQANLNYLLIFSSILIGLVILLYILFNRIKRRKAVLEEEFELMKEELNTYLLTLPSTPTIQEQAQADSKAGTLTERQHKIVAYLKEGKPNKEIAELLFISENTVKYHIKVIYQQLGVKDRKSLSKAGI